MLHIVEVNSSFEKYSKKLEELIGEKGTPVERVSFQEFQNRKLSFMADGRFIFVGTNSLGRPPIPGFSSWKYIDYGCRIGWNGRLCVIANGNDLMLSEYDKFWGYCRRLNLRYPDASIELPPDSFAKEGFEALKKLFAKEAKSIRGAQYSTMIVEFMEKWFDEFIQFDVSNEPGIGDIEIPSNIIKALNKELRSLKTTALSNMTKKQAALCHAVIHGTTAASAVAAFLPIPVADAIPITSAQIAMVVGLGKILENKLTKSDARVLLETVSAPLAGRTLVKVGLSFIPGIGWGINAAIAGVLTEILGWIVAIEFGSKTNT